MKEPEQKKEGEKRGQKSSRWGTYSLLPVFVWKPSPGLAFNPTAKLR